MQHDVLLTKQKWSVACQTQLFVNLLAQIYTRCIPVYTLIVQHINRQPKFLKLFVIVMQFYEQSCVHVSL